MPLSHIGEYVSENFEFPQKNFFVRREIMKDVLC